eukprot:gene33148-42870_t
MFHFTSVQYSESVHERHFDYEERFEGLKQLRRATSDSVHEIVVAIQQNEKGLKKLENIIDDISSPDSLKYREWLTYDKITDLVSNNVGTAAVLSWLKNSYSVSPDGGKVFANVTWQSIRGEYIKATATVDHWENILKTEFYEFSLDEYYSDFKKQKSSQNKVFRSYDYRLPIHLEEHIFSLFNTVQVPPPLRQRYHLRRSTHPVKADTAIDIAGSLSPVTISFLNSLYQVPSNRGSSAQSQAVFATDAGSVSEYFSPDDLTSFQTKYGLPVQAATAVNGNSISPASKCTSNPSTISCSEGNLDIQYISGMAQYTKSLFWYVTNKAGNPDPFVAWITAVAGTSNPPLSNSISWGSAEYYVSDTVMKAFNVEAMKLAALGVTVVASSGDDGAPNQIRASSSSKATCGCSIDSSSSNNKNYWTKSGGGLGTSQTWSGKGYFPNFPASSPYVTAVGATMKKAVSTYLTQANLTAGFNPYGRAYPDISLIGTNYQTYISGNIQSLYGTSASAPVFAAFISLLNARLRSQGRSPVGFINPTLYYAGYNQSSSSSKAGGGKRPQFNDIASGNNKCCADANPSLAVCCKSGFQAATGWDPVTGWGSVNFPSLTAMYNISIGPTLAPTSSPTLPAASSGDVAALIIIIFIVFAVFICFIAVIVVVSLSCGAGVLCIVGSICTAVLYACARCFRSRNTDGVVLAGQQPATIQLASSSLPPPTMPVHYSSVILDDSMAVDNSTDKSLPTASVVVAVGHPYAPTFSTPAAVVIQNGNGNGNGNVTMV